MSILSILNFVVYKEAILIQSYFSEQSSIKDKKVSLPGGNWPRKDNCSGSNLRGCRMDWLDGAKENVNG